jgi:hypothetical protein
MTIWYLAMLIWQIFLLKLFYKFSFKTMMIWFSAMLIWQLCFLKLFLPVLSQNHDDLVLSHVDLANFSYFENVIHSHEDLAMPSLAMLLG